MAAPSVAPPHIGVSITVVNSKFLFCSRGVVKYLTAQGKENYLTDKPPARDSKDHHTWLQEDTTVTTWLRNSMEPLVAATSMWVQTTESYGIVLGNGLASRRIVLELMSCMKLFSRVDEEISR